MKKALVTGGSGFIGGHLVELLERRGYCVVVGDSGVPEYPNRASYEYLDVSAKIGFDARDFDVVFHCAGLLGTETLFDRIKKAAEVNIIGTINLLDWAMGNKENITIVQPNLLGEWLNMYMITKHCAENIGLMYDKEFSLKYLSVRPSDVYGPRQALNEKKAAPIFIYKALHNLPVPIYGDGSSWVNYVYVEDVAAFLVAAYEAGRHGEIIDFCRPDGDMSVKEFAEEVIRISGSDSTIEYCDMRPGQPGNIKYIPYNLRKAHSVFNMQALRSLESGLSESISWYRMKMMD